MTTDLDPKHIERIYREMGRKHWRDDLWFDPVYSRVRCLPDPLTDWSAFGEILEWAEKWTDEHDYRLNIMRTWEWIDGRSQRCYDVAVTLGRAMLSRCVHPDFRAAVLAALAEAIGGPS